ncbi:uncharacterized protein A4U43_C10F19230 [Asparagus officinalis]|uniref:DUF7794 domain-containing protein n=1 Tax=Asparagus officinalis TaxID=4686 RepID=A0A5P1E401_ASPOF|nr:uncharacterized protein A4U43_C10F19230 [Asparagus officinalis]
MLKDRDRYRIDLDVSMDVIVNLLQEPLIDLAAASSSGGSPQDQQSSGLVRSSAQLVRSSARLVRQSVRLVRQSVRLAQLLSPLKPRPQHTIPLQAENIGSVVFFDGANQRFIRSNSMAIDEEDKSLSANEVAATVSVLLGSAPVSLSSDSSFKLNQVLYPSLFDRPHAVLLLEVTGIKDPRLPFAYSNDQLGSAFSSNIVGSSKADIELSDGNEVSRLDDPSSIECDGACIIQELEYLGGRYVSTSEAVDGELSFSLPSNVLSFC